MAAQSSIYLRNLSPKLRPALDLLRATIAALPNQAADVESVLDLGCGGANMTHFLCDAFPNASVHGIDSSPQKIDAAKRGLSSIPGLQHRQVSFEVEKIEDFVKGGHESKVWKGAEKFDVIYANSSLQWLPNGSKRADVLKALISNRLLSKGGVLAVQMPDTARQPSHLLMETAALRSGLIEQTIDVVSTQRIEHDVNWYHHLLTPLCRDVDIWTTEYVHQLPHQGPAKQQLHPVLELTRPKATGLLPYLNAVGGTKTEDGKRFINEYNRLLAEEYPMINAHNPSYKTGKYLSLLPFKRFFLICQS
jgi:trans-aconitate 2-methyltransferase